jgi:hypothetical protein
MDTKVAAGDIVDDEKHSSVVHEYSDEPINDEKNNVVLTKKQRDQLYSRKKRKAQKIKQKTQKEQEQTKNIENKKVIENIESEASKAYVMYRKILELAKSDEKFKQTPSLEKRYDYCKTCVPGFDEFANLFPVISKYMACHGQFHKKAFIRHLIRIKESPMTIEDQKSKKTKYSKWAEHQANYVRYLYEETCHSTHEGINNTYAQVLWKETYDKLIGDFDDFEETYKEVEEREKQKEIQHKTELADELLGRVASGIQPLPRDEMIALLRDVSKSAKKQKEPPVKEAPKPDNDKPTITMIEHVSQEDYDRIDDRYKQPLPSDNVATRIGSD